MSRFWFMLWLILVVLQLLFLLRKTPADPEPLIPETLLELARETNEAWPRLPSPEDPVRAKGASTSGDPLLERESWLLRLRELERAVSDRVPEIHLHADLKQWFAMSRDPAPEAGGTAAVADYLRSLHALVAASEASPATDLQRILLEPPTRSAYPQLSIEMKGNGPGLLEQLEAMRQAAPGWRVDRLELIAEANQAAWWMQGRWVFGEGLP